MTTEPLIRIMNEGSELERLCLELYDLGQVHAAAGYESDFKKGFWIPYDQQAQEIIDKIVAMIQKPS